MNLEHRLLLDELSKHVSDELSKRFDENDLTWSKRLSDRDVLWEQELSDLRTNLDSRLTTVEKVAGALEEWRPEIDGTLDDIKLEMKKLNKHFERSTLENTVIASGIIATAPLAAGVPPAGSTADRPHGQHQDFNHREDGFGSVTAIIHPPVQGMSDPHLSTRSRFHGPTYDAGFSRFRGPVSSNFPTGKLPKLNFPLFDGENSKLWIFSRVEHYFALYHVDSSMWITVAAYHC